jgi:hypothetical protein
MMSNLEANLETCAKCIVCRECAYFCIICNKIFCNECIDSLKQLCSDCCNILLLRDKNKSEESLKEYFIRENNLDNFVQLIKSMNNYLLNEKEKLNSLELQLKQKEKLITDQKMKIENFSSSKPFFDNKKTSKK